MGETAAPHPQADTPGAEPGGHGTATRLGGVFFLLPLLRAFGWPETEEATWHLASTTGTWGVLEALGRALLGDAHDEHDADPLWHVLAHLDGREPGAPPRDAVLPPQTDAHLLGVPGLPPALATWTHGVLPEVEACLGEALGLGGPDELAPVLLVREAALYATPSHVDLVLPLASATLAVRRSGLDVDPGWVPSVGRVVLFHYR